MNLPPSHERFYLMGLKLGFGLGLCVGGLIAVAVCR